jgi:hypothetical protein
MEFNEQTYVEVDYELDAMEKYLTKLAALLEKGIPDGVAGLAAPMVRKPMQEMVVTSRDNIQYLRRAFRNANDHKHRMERSFNVSKVRRLRSLMPK